MQVIIDNAINTVTKMRDRLLLLRSYFEHPISLRFGLTENLLTNSTFNLGIRFNFSLMVHDYRGETKLRKGNVFTSVCQEFCPQGGGVHPRDQTPPCQGGVYSPSVGPPGQTHPLGRHPWADTPPSSRHPSLRQIPLPQADTHG